jgi:glycoside/pentoside/hexuronide:cation symporter, GPH family
MNLANQKLSVTEKVGYSLGDFAANLVFQTLVTYIVYFYTNVYKLESSVASAVIFWCGIIGGVLFAPLMGIIADRTRTRWGRYRPWILWTSVPFGLMILLTFSTPNLSASAKIIYAFGTYLLLVSLYTANNLPYASLSGVLTGSMAERNSLSSYRFVAVMIAQFIIQALMRPIVLMVGDGDEAVGFEKVMTVFAFAGVICFIITFLTTRERVGAESSTETSSLKDDLTDLIRNRPWLIMLSIVILVFITLALKGGMYIYYFDNYVDEEALGVFLQNIGFIGFTDWLNTAFGFEWPKQASASAFGLFNGAGIIFMIIGITFSKPLADRFGKRNIYGIFLTISTVFILAFAIFPRDAVGTMFISQILHGFFYGITIPVMWAMIADVADYSEYKNYRRATGIIFSAMILGLKGGLTLGSTFASEILGSYGYDANLEVQSEEAILGIKLAVSVYAAIPFFIAAASLFYYEINKTMESHIESELAKRR